MWLGPLAFLLAIHAQQPAPDAFVAQRDAAAAKSRMSARFTISLPDGRTTFFIGETIPLTFSYDGVAPTPFNYEDWPHLGLARAVLDHTEGTAYPYEDYDRSGLAGEGGILGGVRGCVTSYPVVTLDGYGNPLPVREPPRCPPVTFTVYLNQDVRFDRAGRYRFYVVDEHVSFLARSAQSGAPREWLVSNILGIHIVEPDPQWIARAAADAISKLDEPNDDRTRIDAARTLAHLGAEPALDEMIARLSSPSLVGDTHRRQAFQFRKGLFAARDRRDVTTRMEGILDDPRRFIPDEFITTLVYLSSVPGDSASEMGKRFDAFRKRHETALRRAIRRQALPQALH